MNRLRACLIALLASGVVMTAARASTIDVTTVADTVADNDNLCSLREAVAASARATNLLGHDNNRIQLEKDRDTLESALEVRLQFPTEYYPRADIRSIITLMRTELEAQTPQSAAEISAWNTVHNNVVDLENDINALPNDKVYRVDTVTSQDASVQRVYDYIVNPGYVLDLVAADIDRLKAKNVADGCHDGSSFDVISLKEGTYTLNSELQLNARAEINGVMDNTISDPLQAIKTVIHGAGTARLLHVLEGFSPTIDKVILENGDATGDLVYPDGGAIWTEGSLTLTDAVLRGNTARDGGAVFVDVVGSLTASRVRFLSNTATRDGGALAVVSQRATLTDVRFGEAGLGNDAQAHGGAIFFNPHSVTSLSVVPHIVIVSNGDLSLDRASLVANTAPLGSAIYLGPGAGYATSVDGRISVVNTTFSGNNAGTAATIDVEATASSGSMPALTLNNVTMIANTGPNTATGGIRVVNPTALVMSNSVIAGNSGMTGNEDCDVAGSGYVDANFNRNYFATGSYPACPGVRQPTGTNYELPLGETVGSWLVQLPFDDEKGIYMPIFPADITDPAENRLVGRGASTQETYRCSDRDQRNMERQSFVDTDCDIGAVEYQIGRRADDTVTQLVNETKCFDIGANDVGDSLYTAQSLMVMAVERAGARAVVASSDVANYQTLHPGVPVVDIATCPNLADLPAGVVDVLMFTPPRDFYGETNVTYALKWNTGVGSPAFGDLSGIAHMVSDSRHSIKSSSIGACGPWLLLLSLLGLRRCRFGVAFLAPLFLLLGAVSAQAGDNIIYVNATADPLVTQNAAGDGKCTLREALETARNDQANLTLGDCLDGNEGPDIVEFLPELDGAGTRTTTITLGNFLTAYGGVTIRCPAPTVIERDSDLLTGLDTHAGTFYKNTGGVDIVLGALTLSPREFAQATSATTAVLVSEPLLTCKIRRDIAGPAFSLINSTGSLTLDDLLLENGDAGINDGGAVSSAGGVSAHRTVFRNNTARTGGAIFLRGLYGDLTLSDSTFEGNRSTGTAEQGGGAVAMTAKTAHKVLISGSTFKANTSADQSAALNIKTTAPVVIANSTFSGNSSTGGSGAIDLTDAGFGVVMRNITVVGNRSGISSGPTQHTALEFGIDTARDALTNSIVSSNRNFLDTLDENCSDPTGLYSDPSFNLYGESATTCYAGPSDQVLPAGTVYDGTPAGYLLPLALNGFTTETHAPDVTKPAVFGTIVDAGYNLNSTLSANLVDPLDAGTTHCAKVDQRGKSREAGGRCDIGAYEYEVVTAVEDKGSNAGRRDRTAIIDILANDVTEDDKRCVPDQIGGPADTVPASPPLKTVRVFETATGRTCAIVTYDSTQGSAYFLPIVPAVKYTGHKMVDDTDTDYEFILDTDSPYVLAYEDGDEDGPAAPTADTDDWANEIIKEAAPRVLTYRAGDSAGNLSSPANISVTIQNVPPFIVNDRVVSPVGRVVHVDILANDIDYDKDLSNDPPPSFNPLLMPPLSSGGLDLTSITLTGSNCTSTADADDVDNDGNRSEDMYKCQFGDAFIESNGVLSWYPRNAFNPFTETLTYQVKDYSYPEKEVALGTGTLTIVMKRPKSSGGGIFGDDLSNRLGIDWLGGAGNLFLLALGACGLRRRRAR